MVGNLEMVCLSKGEILKLTLELVLRESLLSESACPTHLKWRDHFARAHPMSPASQTRGHTE